MEQTNAFGIIYRKIRGYLPLLVEICLFVIYVYNSMRPQQQIVCLHFMITLPFIQLLSRILKVNFHISYWAAIALCSYMIFGLSPQLAVSLLLLSFYIITGPRQKALEAITIGVLSQFIYFIVSIHTRNLVEKTIIRAFDMLYSQLVEDIEHETPPSASTTEIPEQIEDTGNFQ